MGSGDWGVCRLRVVAERLPLTEAVVLRTHAFSSHPLLLEFHFCFDTFHSRLLSRWAALFHYAFTHVVCPCLGRFRSVHGVELRAVSSCEYGNPGPCLGIRLSAITPSHTKSRVEPSRFHARHHAFSPPSIFRTRASCCGPIHTAPKRRMNIFECFKDLNQEAKARIWRRLSYVCHIRSTSERRRYITRRLRALMATTNPESGIKSSFSNPLVCTAGRRIPASSGTNHGNRKRRFGPTLRAGSNLPG